MRSAPDDLPDAAVLASLAGFRGMGPRRLRVLLSNHPPAEAFAVAAGHHAASGIAAFIRDETVRAAWRASALERPPVRCLAELEHAGVQVVVHGGPGYPPTLLDDPLPPPVLFVSGDPHAVDARRVGIVGTRNATRAGLETAAVLGRELANADVAIVSGLARGIDGAAHRGALSGSGGRPIAVVGNGLDAPYPRQNAALWRSVVECGVVFSEWPPGTPPDAWRFPMRNRILAALCEVLVVVESRESGGSLITVNEAADRSVTVMAVPGSPSNRASSGTNWLLTQGAAPVTSVDDVLVALGLDTRRAGATRFDPRPRPRGCEVDVLECCRREPRTLDDVVRDCDLDVVDAAMALARLERAGWLTEAGGWFEAVGVTALGSRTSGS